MLNVHQMFRSIRNLDTIEGGKWNTEHNFKRELTNRFPHDAISIYLLCDSLVFGWLYESALGDNKNKGSLS